MNVLVACEYSGVVRDAFRARGHNAWSCDILPTDKPGPHFTGDVLAILALTQGHWDLLIAHPPCTRLTLSGVRWLHKPPEGRTVAEMWAELDEAATFYKALRDADVPRKAIENPLMHRYAKERVRPGPRQVVQPHWFGCPEFKATGLELIGLPPLVATNPLTPPKKGTREHDAWSYTHRLAPSPDRWKLRSTTKQGIADAMAAQWGLT